MSHRLVGDSDEDRMRAAASQYVTSIVELTDECAELRLECERLRQATLVPRQSDALQIIELSMGLFELARRRTAAKAPKSHGDDARHRS